MPKAAELTVIGLHANQHRAIDYAGIVSSDGSNLYRERGPGLARQVFTKEMLDRLHGRSALGHIRYPTVEDDDTRDNIQPILGNSIALAHNGNLTNIQELQEIVPHSKRMTSMDSEYILRLLETQKSGDIETDLLAILPLLKGSFTLGIILPDKLIAVQSGTMPLSIGKAGDGYFISSETCAFPNVGARHIRDIKAGEIVTISQSGLKVNRFNTAPEKKCRFQGVYFSHPSSTVFSERLTQFRIALGRSLEIHFPVRGGADIVTPIPDSANFIAKGYGESGRSGKHLEVILRNHYMGRTFIAATQARRDLEVSQKFTFSTEEIEGKNIVVIDDSIVRGTTLPKIVTKLRELGAKAVHVRIGFPPIRFSCHYGINTPTSEELIAAKRTNAEICELVGADSLEFMSLEILKTLSPEPEKFCFACINGEYW